MNRDQITKLWSAAFQGDKAVIESFMKDPNVNIFHAKSSALFLAAAGHHLELVNMLLAANEKRDITNDAVYHLDVATDKENINRAITFLLRIPNTIERHSDRRIMALWNKLLEKENKVIENGKILYTTMIGTGRYNYNDIKSIVGFWPDVFDTSSVIDTKERTLERFLDRIKPSHVRTEGCPCRNCQVQFHVVPKCYIPDKSTIERTRIDTLCFGKCKKDNGLCRENDCRCHCTICTEKWVEKMGEQNTTLLHNSFTVNKTIAEDEVGATTRRVRFSPNTTERVYVKGAP